MATCKDCVHFDVCCSYLSTAYNKCKLATPDFKLLKNIECDECQHFKDRSRFVELPCKLGDTLYVPHGSYIMEQIVVSIEFTETNITIHAVDKLTYIPILILPESIGVLAFLTRDEAEQRLDGGRKND